MKYEGIAIPCANVKMEGLGEDYMLFIQSSFDIHGVIKCCKGDTIVTQIGHNFPLFTVTPLLHLIEVKELPNFILLISIVTCIILFFYTKLATVTEHFEHRRFVAFFLV